MRILHSKKFILISKPRSGSTSLRRAVDPFVEEGDIVCNTPYDDWHPHHTALRLRWLFEKNGWDFDEYVKLCTARNPFDLVRSYYAYFKPDAEGRYSYESAYDGSYLMPFRQWVLEGRIWDQTYRQKSEDLRAISIDAYCFDQSDRCIADYIVDVNDWASLEEVISASVGVEELAVPHVNRSSNTGPAEGLLYDDDMEEKIRRMFWREFELFDYDYAQAQRVPGT